jgi:hypothetical protein
MAGKWVLDVTDITFEFIAFLWLPASSHITRAET